MGKMGERAMQMAVVLLNSNLVHFFWIRYSRTKVVHASITDSVEKSIVFVGEEKTGHILFTNPLSIINSEEITLADVQQITVMKKPGLLK